MAKAKKKSTSKLKANKTSKIEREEDLENEEETENEDDFTQEDETETAEFEDDPQPIEPTHKRSNGLFNNPWWKRGLLKGFIVWLIFVVFFYLMDFIGLIEVIDKVRWFLFLVLLVILAMAWEKFFYKYVKI